jgi:hypothetical protein
MISLWQTRRRSPDLRKIRRAIVAADPAAITNAKTVLAYWLKEHPELSELKPILNALPKRRFPRSMPGVLLKSQAPIPLEVVRKVCVEHPAVFLTVWAADMIDERASCGRLVRELQKRLTKDVAIAVGDRNIQGLHNLWTSYGLPRFTRRSFRCLAVDLRHAILDLPPEMRPGILADELCIALEENPLRYADTPESRRLAKDKDMLATVLASLRGKEFTTWRLRELSEILLSPYFSRFERSLLRALGAGSKTTWSRFTSPNMDGAERTEFLRDIEECPSPLLLAVLELVTLPDCRLGLEISRRPPEALAAVLPLLSSFDIIRAAPTVAAESTFWTVADRRAVMSAARVYGRRVTSRLKLGYRLQEWPAGLAHCWLASLRPGALMSALTSKQGTMLTQCSPAAIDTLPSVEIGEWLESNRPAQALDVLLNHENGIRFLGGVVAKRPSVVEHFLVDLYARTSAQWLGHRSTLLRIIVEGCTSPVALLPPQIPLQSAELSFLLTSASTEWQDTLLTRAAASPAKAWKTAVAAAREHRTTIKKKLQGRIAAECPVAHRVIFKIYPDLFRSVTVMRTLSPKLLCLGIPLSAAYRSRLEAAFSRAELAGWAALSRRAFARRPLLQACVELSLSFSLWDFAAWMELLKDRMTAYHEGNYRAGYVFDKRYHTWLRPKKSGDNRLITAPDALLKRIQTRLLRQGFETIELEPAAHGFRKAHSPLTNAAPHVNRDLIVNADIDKFFDSTGYGLIVSAAGQLCDGRLSTHARMCVADVCSFAGVLPTGAPTSPAIGNIILTPVDRALTTVCERKGIAYTRYADDLTFSGDGDTKRVLPFVRKVLADFGYSLADKKTHLYRRGRQQVVTGLVVNEKVNCPRAFRRCLRAAVDHFCKGQTPWWHGKPMERRQLVGRISLLKTVQPAEFARHTARLAAMDAEE